jgi:lipoprotein-anchoring transpeptidase ErfK/SrfK
MKGTTGIDRGGAAAHGGRRRRRRLWIWPVTVIVLMAIAAGVYLAFQDSRAVALGSISPAPDSLLSTRPVTVFCELTRFLPGRGTVTMTVDGRPIAAGGVVVRPGFAQAELSLADGPHTVVVAYDSTNLFSRHVERSWGFSVDTTPPTVSVASPASFPLLTAHSTRIALDLSEAGSASLTLDGAPVALASGGEAATAATVAKADLVAEEGKHVLAATAADEAGNVTTEHWDLMVDYKAPKLSVAGLPEVEIWNELNSASVGFTVSDSFPDRLKIAGSLDGAALVLQEGAAASSGERRFAFETGTLPEGTHDIELSATDLGGHETTVERHFLVDTSSIFGARTLTKGAEGEDVKQLQRILKIKGVYPGDPTGLLDDATATAVAAFNSQQGIGGRVVTEQTLKYLLGTIRIDLSERTLYLYGGDDQLITTYRVAVGMPAYPTPTGTFRIMTKAKNPTWNPPDSAWAAGMGPVAPGDGNPLGTRWMGLNSPGIGIHGTPTPSSIGSAASHGCIRMKIPDAEDLFDRVFVGTPVEIIA